jgi:diguanylate cyclase (GGDEF)-like protein/PAS domain S-box-containing protein
MRTVRDFSAILAAALPMPHRSALARRNALDPSMPVSAAVLPAQRKFLGLLGAALAACSLALLGAEAAIHLSAASVEPAWHTRLLVAALLTGVAAVSLLAWRLRQARSSATAIEAAFESNNVGVAIFDAQDRLVRCNEAYRELYPELRHLMQPGVAYDDLMRAYFPVAAKYLVGDMTLEQFIESTRKRRRGVASSEVVRRHSGRWLLMTDAQTATGGIVSFRIDVTEHRLTDLELRHRRRVADEIGDLTFDWFWRQDAEGRFVELSVSMHATFGYSPEHLIGKKRTEIRGFTADPAELVAYEASIAARQPFPWFRYRCLNGAGQPIWVAVTGKPLFNGDGAFQGYFGVARDVTERESIIAALRRSEERLRALTALATEWYWETDADLRVTSVKGPGTDSDTVEGEFRGKALALLGTHRCVDTNWTALRGLLERREGFRRLPFRIRLPEDRVVYFETSAEPVLQDGQFTGYRGLAWDVTEREALLARVTESEARFRALTELSSDWYWETDSAGRLCAVRQGANAREKETLTLVGKAFWDIDHELVQPATWDEHRAQLAVRKPFRDLLVRRWQDRGAPVYTLISGDPVFDPGGAFRGYRGVGKNITEQVRAQERIERLATIDPLTQLANRQSFDERAQSILGNAYADGRQCALLFIDLDNFRLLNNGYGHRVGDRMLSIVAGRMRAVVGEPNLLGRRGGDELVVLLVDVPRPVHAVEVAQQLIKSISEPERVLGMEVSVTPSIGIGFFPTDGVDLDSLLSAADAAMYQAKEGGRKTYAFYTPTVARRVDLRLRLEQRLRKAVESRDFRLFYQPLVSLADGKMIGAEALIRWKDAELGEISPGEFIPIAEESGLIIGLGDWVNREAARARRVWRALGLDLPPVAVNFSGVQLRQLGCVESLLEVLNDNEVPAGDVEVEVTETGLLDTSAVARENLIRLRNAGVKIALDDFGVGFSSLSHLRDLPIHRLKIDRSFTVECMRDARTLTIVKAVIEMARSLGIAVTAEGIETQAQQTWMQHLGCDSAQGYLFARPMPADDFLKLFLDKKGVGRERSLMH